MMNKIIGKVALHPSKSFAFVRVDGLLNSDIFVPPALAKDVFYGDIVEAEYEDGERPSAQCLTVLHSPDRKFTGTVVFKYDNYVIVPDNYINKEFKLSEQEGKACLNHRVVVQMEASPSGLLPKIVYVAPLNHEPFSETALTLAKYEIDETPLSVENVTPSFEAYEDLTALPFVTIDSETTQDVDDAVCAQQLGEGEWRLWVAIADASAYVPLNSELDKKARARGTTFYFPSKVITMLPGELSHDKCSLLPNRSRAALVAQLRVTEDAVSLERLVEGKINSKRKMSYTEVDAFEQGLSSFDADIQQSLQALLQVYHTLNGQRIRRGANVERTTSWYITTDSKGKMSGMEEVPWSISYGVVEECMLAANSQVAEFMAKNGIPGIFRHQPLVEDSVLSESVLPVYHDLVGEVKEPEFSVWKNVASAHPRYVKALRMAMESAVYDSGQHSHFSLQYAHYAHFTSPIRRYSDLWNHRVLKAFLRGENLDEYRVLVEDVAVTCSAQHNVAKRAPRYLEKLLLANYAQGLVGQEMPAIVSGGTARGIFVEAQHVFHGMVLRDKLLPAAAEWSWDAVLHKGVFQSVRQLGVGDALTVVLNSVDLLKLRLEFSEVDKAV